MTPKQPLTCGFARSGAVFVGADPAKFRRDSAGIRAKGSELSDDVRLDIPSSSTQRPALAPGVRVHQTCCPMRSRRAHPTKPRIVVATSDSPTSSAHARRARSLLRRLLHGRPPTRPRHALHRPIARRRSRWQDMDSRDAVLVLTLNAPPRRDSKSRRGGACVAMRRVDGLGPRVEPCVLACHPESGYGGGVVVQSSPATAGEVAE